MAAGDDPIGDGLELDVDGRQLAVGSGQFCEVLGADRLHVLDIASPRPSLLWDGPVERADRDDVVDRLRSRAASVQIVELDTMARTRWRLMWTIDDRPFVLWDRLGRRLRLEDGYLRRRGRDPIPNATATRVVVATDVTAYD